ncbi:MAG: dihydrolipoamide acetyltransferase family protein [Anaerolineales bacterium]
MSIDIVMPPLSQTSDTLILTGWLKKVGEPVAKGEALFEVETDKATLTVESPASGTLAEILAEPGAEVAVKSIIGSIAAPQPATGSAAAPPPAGASAPADVDKDGAAAPVAAPVRASGSTPAPVIAAALQAKPAPNAPRSQRLLASPRARRLADQQGISLHGLPATGPRGMIVERDVRAYLASVPAPAAVLPARSPAPLAPTPAAVQPATFAAPPAAPPTLAGSRHVPLSATRKTIARRLQASHQTTTPVTLTRDTDATELVALRERLLADPASQDARPSYTDLLVSIAARCLLRHPHLNAHFDGEQLELFDAVDMGLAVDTERGLLVPVLRDVAHKGLTALTRERTALVQRALDGSATPADLSDGTFTLTNLGTLGVDAFTPMLNPPQIAILGVGRIRAIAAPYQGAVAIRQAMFLSLTFDHRAVDGAPAARLLADIAALVERPERVWL